MGRSNGHKDRVFYPYFPVLNRHRPILFIFWQETLRLILWYISTTSERRIPHVVSDVKLNMKIPLGYVVWHSPRTSSHNRVRRVAVERRCANGMYKAKNSAGTAALSQTSKEVVSF